MAGRQTLTPWRLGEVRYSSPPVFNKKQHYYTKLIIFYRSEATLINIKYKSHVTSNANENWTANIYTNNYQESFVVICGQVWKRLSNVNLKQSCTIYKRNSTVFACYKTQKNILNRGPQTAQKYRNHFQILATRKMTWSKSLSVLQVQYKSDHEKTTLLLPLPSRTQSVLRNKHNLNRSHRTSTTQPLSVYSGCDNDILIELGASQMSLEQSSRLFHQSQWRAVIQVILTMTDFWFV